MAPVPACDGADARAALCAELQAIDSALLQAHAAFVDEACLARCLRARKGNIGKAAHLLLSTLKWRDSIGVQKLRTDEFEAELQSGKLYVKGADSAGRALLVTRKRADAFKAGETDHYLRHLAFTLETACRAMRGGAEAWVWIMDLGGMTRANSPPINVSLATLRVLADHFPERLHTCFFVDAPSVFGYLWAALSPFIDPVTKSKVIFIKSAEWRERMESKRAGAGSDNQADAASADQKAAHVPDGRDFAQYWDVYETPYDEAAYRKLLASVGWP